MEPTAQERAGNDSSVSKANNGSYTNNMYIVPTQHPNVCPGCGRCKECGQPYPQQQPQVWPYQSPYLPTITGGSLPYPNTGTINVNAQNASAAH